MHVRMRRCRRCLCLCVPECQCMCASVHLCVGACVCVYQCECVCRYVHVCVHVCGYAFAIMSISCASARAQHAARFHRTGYLHVSMHKRRTRISAVSRTITCTFAYTQTCILTLLDINRSNPPNLSTRTEMLKVLGNAPNDPRQLRGTESGRIVCRVRHCGETIDCSKDGGNHCGHRHRRHDWSVAFMTQSATRSRHDVHRTVLNV